MGSRTRTALVGLAASLAVNAAVYYYTGWFVFFIALPFVPLLFRGDDRPPARECPQCGFSTRDPAYEYCPRDGARLVER
ncbi:hypothetical protein [Salarchaeum sp. JOR-1]|uniref:hypothetical protein n=1 Tax=Salarchaeum sp. JOR-1 TaxID=2599399 RepID=UPI001198891C|nr:hypothetical protein [Salarchaeum sp. JOR-1]QDX41671.1 hypothetical protein FQU85_12430 [Salarchaeum sp. JOR-1]